jgi:hypothetical protein
MFQDGAGVNASFLIAGGSLVYSRCLDVERSVEKRRAQLRENSEQSHGRIPPLLFYSRYFYGLQMVSSRTLRGSLRFPYFESA